MQAIRTTYHGPGNVRGSRIKATCAAKSIILDYDHSLSHGLDNNHRKAAETLIEQLGWNEPGYGLLVSGCLPDGSYCHVLTGRNGIGDTP